MLGDSALLGAAAGGGGGSSGGGEGGGSSSADAVAAVAASGRGSQEGAGGGGSNSGDEERGRMVEEGERSGGFGGNRWPRQETLALLRIRSDMDVAFRDATVKGPLWEQVSRKMAELGYHRSAKKCKEKFENVYKYHKRTKEGRGGKSDGKTYRFFDQLEALDNIHQPPNPPPPSLVVTTAPAPPPPPPPVPTTTTTTLPMAPPQPPQVTVSSTALPMAITQGIVTAPSINLTIPSYPTPPPPPPPVTTNPTNILFPNPTTPNPTAAATTNIPPPPPPSISLPTISFPNIPADLLSSSTSSDETLDGRRKRKRKWKDFFDKLMKEVVEKQEELQKRFLEAVEKRERERTAREEAWRVQEMQRINREREILAQERSIAAAKDAAVMSFLQKIAEQQNLGQALTIVQPLLHQPQPQPQPVAQSNAPQAPPPVQQQPPPAVAAASVAQPVVMAPSLPPLPPAQHARSMEMVRGGNSNGENATAGSTSSRWPKVEVQALIKLRTSLDQKYQENGPKGPLWEEISGSMRRLGYNRNAKRCKEKWENINKYFKKVKESKRQRREDSKTCPYFKELDALYREKNKHETSQAVPLMVRPEQQWPPQLPMENVENDPMDDEDDMERDIAGDEEEDEEDEAAGRGGGSYEIVASKAPATTTTTTTSVGA